LNPTTANHDSFPDLTIFDFLEWRFLSTIFAIGKFDVKVLSYVNIISPLSETATLRAPDDLKFFDRFCNNPTKIRQNPY